MKNQKIVVAVAVVMAIVALAGVQSANAAIVTDGVLLQTDVQEILSLDCGADVDLGALTPGTPVTGETICGAITNANGGYTLAVKRDNATGATMKKDTDAQVIIADKAAWTPGTPNSAVYSGTGLGFTVFVSDSTKNTTWWGTGSNAIDTGGLNKYAGFDTAQTDIMVHTVFTSGLVEHTSIGYKLDVPSTQKSGAYSGSITYQVTTTP